MACELITAVEALYASYNSLLTRCCIEVGDLSHTDCVVSSIQQVYQKTLELFTPTAPACRPFTASVGSPEPGQPGPCLSAEWIRNCQAWLDGITCGGGTPLPPEPSPECPTETCFQFTRSPDEATGQLLGSENGCIYRGHGFTLQWNDTASRWDLYYGGVTYDSGSSDKGNPRGNYSTIGINISIGDCSETPDPPENCIDFEVEFPRQDLPGSGCSRKEIKVVPFSNPLDVNADLIVTETASFDDDLEVGGVSVGGVCAAVITISVGTALVEDVAPGETVELTLIDNFGFSSWGKGKACWRPTVGSLE